MSGAASRRKDEMKLFKISYKCGTSPFWYNVSIYGNTIEEAVTYWLKHEAPYNTTAMKAEEIPTR